MKIVQKFLRKFLGLDRELQTMHALVEELANDIIGLNNQLDDFRKLLAARPPKGDDDFSVML